MTEQMKESWGAGQFYDRYVGRWSRLVAKEFLAWLGVPANRAWGDVGCGTGALVEDLLERREPKSVLAIDRSRGFVADARAKFDEPRVQFAVADATALPWETASCDATVSGLVLNFVQDAARMAREMRRVTRPRGRVAAYVWDYSSGMEMMRHFWDAALEVSPQDRALDQAERFPLCQPGPLERLFQDSGLGAVEVRALDIPTDFESFDDYWMPFLGKQGAAPTYLSRLDQATREQIRAKLRSRLAPAGDGPIHLSARAWAVQGVVHQRL